jgi:hypothetical protein
MSKLRDPGFQTTLGSEPCLNSLKLYLAPQYQMHGCGPKFGEIGRCDTREWGSHCYTDTVTLKARQNDKVGYTDPGTLGIGTVYREVNWVVQKHAIQQLDVPCRSRCL